MSEAAVTQAETTPRFSDARRLAAAELLFRALRRGEASAASRVAPYLAPGVTLESRWANAAGADAVAEHVGKRWPNTSVYEVGTWAAPELAGDTVVISGEFPQLGAAPRAATITVAFDDSDRITRILEVSDAKPRAHAVPTIPSHVAALIDGALANGTPVVIAHVSLDGKPVVTLRGSLQVYSPAQLSIWIRNPEGGLATSVGANPSVSLLYRDSKLRTTLTFTGLARIEQADDIRTRAYELAPEAEQMHDPRREGAALIIDVTSITGATLHGPVLMQAAADD
jgi:hypothetical protein